MHISFCIYALYLQQLVVFKLRFVKHGCNKTTKNTFINNYLTYMQQFDKL